MLVVKLAFAGALIWAMIHFEWLRLDDVASVRSKPLHLAGAALLMLVGLVLTAVRWRMLLAVQGIAPGLWGTLRLSFIGFFFSCVIPGSVSGDAVKAYYVARDHKRVPGAVASVLADRFLGLYTLAVMSSVAVGICWWSGASSRVFSNAAAVAGCWAVVGVALGMTVLASALFSRRVRGSGAVTWLLRYLPFRRFVCRLYDAVYLYRDRKGPLVRILLVSVAAQVPMVLGTYALGRALGDAVLRVAEYFFLTPVGLVVNSIPILPGGLVTGELAYELLFDGFGSSVGAEVAALWHVLFFGWSLIGMVLYVKGKKVYDALAREASTLGASDAAVDVH